MTFGMPIAHQSDMMWAAPPKNAIVPSMKDTHRLQLISEITQRINLGNSLEEVFDLIYERLRNFVPYNRIAVAVADEKKERLTILVAKSDGTVVLGKGYSGLIAGSSLEPLIREGTIRTINDLQAYLAQKPSSESTRLIVKEGMRASLTLPLYIHGQSTGVMFFSSREPNVYKPEHEEFLQSIVGHMAIAVEKSRLMDALKDKTEYLENILHHSADAIIVADRKNIIRSWNEGARHIFGYSAEDVMGQHFSILLPPELRESDELKRIQERVETEGFLKDYEMVLLTKDGRHVAINLTSTLLRDRRDQILGRSAILRDITRVKKLHEDLVRSQSLAAVGELAATVAHEIKNPLAGISGAIQVLADAIPSSDSRRSVVGEILAQIQRLDTTVRDLLTFSRPMTPRPHELDLGETLSRSWSLLSQQPGGADICFTMTRTDGLRVTADGHLLQQVWVNLFQNALEAMPHGGTLTVEASDGPSVCVRIQDTGHGMDAAQMSKLFRPFVSTKTRGTGLGLAISKKIVEAHGGTIRIESKPKEGTTVVVEIPR